MKKAIIIYGLGAPIYVSGEGTNSDRFAKFIKTLDYDLELIDPVDLGVGKRVIEEIKEKIDLIVGISLGGLWAQRMASEHPEAKLLLIATFPTKTSQMELVDQLIRWIKKGWILRLLEGMKVFSTRWWVMLYLKFNPVPPGSNSEIKRLYLEEMTRNVDYFKKLSIEDAKKIIGVLESWDNREILKQLKNKTLILAGENDQLCPVTVARLMNNSIKNSELVVSSGGHFNVFNEESEGAVKEFLGVK